MPWRKNAWWRRIYPFGKNFSIGSVLKTLSGKIRKSFGSSSKSKRWLLPRAPCFFTERVEPEKNYLPELFIPIVEGLSGKSYLWTAVPFHPTFWKANFSVMLKGLLPEPFATRKASLKWPTAGTFFLMVLTIGGPKYKHNVWGVWSW